MQPSVGCICGIEVYRERSGARSSKAGLIGTSRRVKTSRFDLVSCGSQASQRSNATDLYNGQAIRVNEVQLRPLGFNSHFSFLVSGLSGTTEPAKRVSVSQGVPYLGVRNSTSNDW